MVLGIWIANQLNKQQAKVHNLDVSTIQMFTIQILTVYPPCRRPFLRYIYLLHSINKTPHKSCSSQITFYYSQHWAVWWPAIVPSYSGEFHSTCSNPSPGQFQPHELDHCGHLVGHVFWPKIILTWNKTRKMWFYIKMFGLKHRRIQKPKTFKI